MDSSSAFDQISGSQIKGDKISSLNGNLEIDLQGDRFVVKDGVVDRIELGRLSNGEIGLIIRDSDGNELMRITGEKNIIRSSNGNVELDFIEQWFLVKDDGGNVRVLLGKGSF